MFELGCGYAIAVKYYKDKYWNILHFCDRISGNLLLDLFKNTLK